MVYDHDHDDRITRVDISHPENIFMVNTNFMKYSGIQSKSVCQNVPEVFQSLHFDNEYKSTSFRFATGLDKYTVRRLYFETLEGRFMFSLTFWKLSLDFNLEYLSHFFINFNNQ